jgi:hypothetical protein
VAGMTHEERAIVEQQLARVQDEIAKTDRALRDLAAPYAPGEPKNAVKGLVEQRYAALLAEEQLLRERLEE